MEIIKINENKKKYIDLLLLADEQENMIDKYIERGDMYILKEEGRAIGCCVVTKEGEGIYEIKNLAVIEERQKMGYGKRLIEFVEENYSDCSTLYVGTGESDMTLPFYEKCGFVISHRIKDFFTDNYDKPIIENGVCLKDMVVLKKLLNNKKQ